MQVRLCRAHPWLLLLGLWGCVDRDPVTPGSSQAPTPAMAGNPSRALARSSPTSDSGVPSPKPAPTGPKTVALSPPAQEPGSASEIRLQMTREALLKTLGRCQSRTVLIPPAKDRLVTEIFQPLANDGQCVKQFGARRFVLVGGKLTEILNGMDAPVVMATPPDRG